MRINYGTGHVQTSSVCEIIFQPFMSTHRDGNYVRERTYSIIRCFAYHCHHLLNATSGSLRKVVYFFMCPLAFWDFWQWSNSLNLFWKVIHLISFYIVKSHWLNKECIIYLLVTQDCRVAWYLSDVHSHTSVCVLHCEPAIPPVQSESPCGQLSPKFIPVIKVYLQL